MPNHVFVIWLFTEHYTLYFCFQEERKSSSFINYDRGNYLYRGEFRWFAPTLFVLLAINYRSVFALSQFFHRVQDLLHQKEKGLDPGRVSGEGAGPTQGQEHHNDAGAARPEHFSTRDQGAQPGGHNPEPDNNSPE